jgi:dTDP-4-dehydrorhamnose reductase
METLSPNSLPPRIADEAALEEVLSRPSQGLRDDLQRLDGDILILGVGGKVGPTLARLAKRAVPAKRIVGVARFSDPSVRTRLESWGVETLVCDLLDPAAVAALPRLPNVVFMAGKKFGTAVDPAFTWAMNTHVPALAADVFSESRIVAFSTLCVYPYAPVAGEGWDESVDPEPVGEYANSCVGRERIFQHFSQRHETPGRLLRLNYAIDMRYGVLYDVARRVHAGEPVPLTMVHVNVIWQGDASAHALRALLHCTTPTSPLNIGGTESTSIRALAHAFGERYGKTPQFDGAEADTAWINCTAQAQELFGPPVVPLKTMLDWTADWIERALPVYDLPTHFWARNGKF